MASRSTVPLCSVAVVKTERRDSEGGRVSYVSLGRKRFWVLNGCAQTLSRCEGGHRIAATSQYNLA